MKIGFFTDSYLPVTHGVEISIETFRKSLEKLGHQVFIYAPHHPGYKDKNTRVFRLKSIRVVKKPEMRFALPFVADGRLKELVDFKLDIVHAQTPFSLGILGKFIAERQKIPLVYTHHTHYPEYAKVYFKEKFILPFAAKVLTSWFSNASSAVIAPSLKIKNLLKKYGVKKPIYILPTGINLNLFKITNKSKKEAKVLREKLKIKAKEKLMIFVGRIGKEKNIDFLIKSFGEIYKKEKSAKLLIVGDGPDLERLKFEAGKTRLNNIVFIGPLPHDSLPVYYQAADLFVFPSLTETQGIVILEAMGSGLPILTLKDEAFSGVVLNNKNGFLVKTSSPKTFARKALEILNNKNLKEKFSKNSYKLAKNFSEEKQAEKLVKIYKNFLRSY